MVTVTAEVIPAVVNLEAYHGDSWSQQFRFVDDVGDGLDLSSATIASCVRGTDGTLIALVVQLVDPADGVFALVAPFGGLPVDVYRYDVQTTDAGGATMTYLRGALQVLPDVTP